MPTYDYPRPAVTVDIVWIRRMGDRPAEVLLIRRGGPPFAGHWALPGGFVDMDEDLETAARRELREETGLAAPDLSQLAAFGAPGRDPRGRVISIAFWGLTKAIDTEPRAGDDAAEVRWFSIYRLPPLAFDHAEIIETARRRIHAERAETDT